MATSGSLRRKLVVIVELILLLGVIAFSLTAVVNIILLKSDFLGDCPLYPTVNDYGYFNFQVKSDINCNYVIGANVVSAVVSLIAMVYVIFEKVTKKRLFSHIPTLKTVLYGLLVIIVGVSAGIVTVGFLQICNGLETLVDRYHDYTTCKDWQQDKYWDIYGYDASHFHFYLFVTQTASTISTIIWLVVFILSLVIAACFTRRSGDEDDQAFIL